MGDLALFGVLGVPAGSNTPGIRSKAAAWVDLAGRLWMFGGAGYADTLTAGLLSDVWSFDLGTSWWTWMGGKTYIGDAGSYGTLGVSSPTNLPPARHAPAVWRDASGTVWMYGGSVNLTVGALSDLWKADP